MQEILCMITDITSPQSHYLRWRMEQFPELESSHLYLPLLPTTEFYLLGPQGLPWGPRIPYVSTVLEIRLPVSLSSPLDYTSAAAGESVVSAANIAVAGRESGGAALLLFPWETTCCLKCLRFGTND